jgi:hypothetical protein
MAFLTKSTLATQANKAWEVGEEMDIDSHRMGVDIGTKT